MSYTNFRAFLFQNYVKSRLWIFTCETLVHNYLKCGATSPFGNNIPASMRNFLAASLLATEAFLAASNLSCLLLSNKSIFYLLVLKVEHFFCKDYANERNVSLLTDCRVQLIFCKDYASECNESLLSDCRAPLIFCKDTLFFWKMQGIIEKCLRMREINRRIKNPGSSPASNNLGEGLTGTALQR